MSNHLPPPPPPPPIPVDYKKMDTLEALAKITESGPYFEDIKEMYQVMSTLMDLKTPHTKKIYVDCVRLRVRYEVGNVDFKLYLAPQPNTIGGPIFIETYCIPGSVLAKVSDTCSSIKKFLLEQAYHSAVFLRTGFMHPDCLLPEDYYHRIPGNKNNAKFKGQHPSTLPIRDAHKIDLVFQQNVDQLGNPIQTYKLLPVTDAGAKRVEYEVKMNYPEYTLSDLRAALYHMEALGLHSIVRGPGNDVILDSKQVVVEIDGAKVEIPFAKIQMNEIFNPNPDFND